MESKRDTQYFEERRIPDKGGYYYSRECGHMEKVICPKCNKTTINAFRMKHNISGRESAMIHCGECGRGSAGMFWKTLTGKIVYE